MITLRSYQTRAVAALIAIARGIVQAPAGSGKTVIGAAALAQWMAKQPTAFPKVFWLANTKEQCDQARAALAHFPEVEQWCVLVVGCYAAGISCAGADLVILDECHHVAAPEVRKCLDGYEGPRWGLSATPQRADDRAYDVFEIIGPIVCIIERAELIQAGQLAAARVRFHAPNGPREYEDLVNATAEPLIQQRKRFWQGVTEEDIRKRTLWQCCLELGMYKNRARNRAALQLAQDHAEDSVLLLVSSVEHGEGFQQRIPGSALAHSKMGARARRLVMERFRARDLRCLIATSLADEGLDLPCANVLILVAGGRSAAKAEQRTGRVLRAWKDKTHGLIHDFYDHQHYFLRAQSMARARVYAQLGYELEWPENIEKPGQGMPRKIGPLVTAGIAA